MFEIIVVIGEPEFWPFDLWVDLEERAAILEFDGGYSREEAERLAQIELGISTDEEDQ